MPSASTNSNNKNKLMKQTSFGCSSAGGGGSGPGGPGSAPVAASVGPTAPMVPDGVTKISAASAAMGTASPSPPQQPSPPPQNATNNPSNISNASESNMPSANNTENVLATATVVKGGEKLLASSINVAAATVSATSDLTVNPMRQALITIEHKIRNLEKRKTKLESYRAIQANGKELSSDQKAAVAKYDAVMATLEFARDLSKQMVQFSKDAEKDQKKQARKDIIAKAQAETVKIREVLIIQNILSCFADEAVRSDFLNGENGAIKLESSDLGTLEQFCMDIQTHRPETGDGPSFISIAQKAAEYFSMTIDGRPKQYSETTFENLRRIFNQIQECGYLDKLYLTIPPEAASSNVESNDAEGVAGVDENAARGVNCLENDMEKLHLTDSGAVNVGSDASNTPIILYDDMSDGIEQPHKEQMVVVVDQMQKQNALNAMSSSSNAPPVAFAGPPNRQRSGTTTPVHVTAMYASAPNTGGPPPQQVPPQMQQVVVPVPPQPSGVPLASQLRGAGVAAAGGVQLPPPAMPPIHGAPPPPGGPYSLTTVRAVEQDFFKQHQQQKYVQQMRPLAEVIGTGSFYFLQDSELDSPEIISGAGPGSGSGNATVFDPQAPNLMVHMGDVPMPPGTAVDMQQQSKKLASQPPPDAQHTLQQQPSQPITTQTFTNQAFPPPIQPQPPAQHQQRVETPATAGVGVASKTPTLNSNSSSNTPTPMFQQTQPSQLQSKPPPLLYSPDLVIGANAAASKGGVSQQQQPMMIMARLATPQARMAPMQSNSGAVNVPPQQQPQHSSGFPFDPIVTSFGGYEQLAAVGVVAAQTKSAAAVAPASVDEKVRKISATTAESLDPASTVGVGDWETTIKGHAATRSSNAAKVVALNALKQHSGGGAGPLEPVATNKWSSEMNALSSSSAASGAPPTVVAATHHNNNSQARKNEWSAAAAGGTGGGGGSSNYNSDVVTTHSDNNSSSGSNHWNSSQAQQHDGSASGGYNRGGGGGRSSNSSYQRRNDDRRGGERGSGGGTSGTGNSSNYRNRSNNNYSSGGPQQQQQNGSGRGNGGSGMYFRNNEGAPSNTAAAYYQNGGGGIYSKDGGNSGTRYETGGGNSSYRGPRGNANQRNQGPPRAIGRNTSGNNTSTGGSGGYLNSRQTNRMSLGLEKN